jgi:hypothetical protein
MVFYACKKKSTYSNQMHTTSNRTSKPNVLCERREQQSILDKADGAQALDGRTAKADELDEPNAS